MRDPARGVGAWHSLKVVVMIVLGEFIFWTAVVWLFGALDRRISSDWSGVARATDDYDCQAAACLLSRRSVTGGSINAGNFSAHRPEDRKSTRLNSSHS